MSKEPTAAQKMIGDFAPKLVDLTDRVLFGEVWERSELSKRDRSLASQRHLQAVTNPLDSLALSSTENIRRSFKNGKTKNDSAHLRGGRHPSRAGRSLPGSLSIEL